MTKTGRGGSVPRLPIGQVKAGASVKFNCPRCTGQSTAYLADSREVTHIPGTSRRRKYVCTACGHRWMTHEVNASDNPDLIVQNKARIFLKEIDALTRRIFADEVGDFPRLAKDEDGI